MNFPSNIKYLRPFYDMQLSLRHQQLREDENILVKLLRRYICRCKYNIPLRFDEKLLIFLDSMDVYKKGKWWRNSNQSPSFFVLLSGLATGGICC